MFVRILLIALCGSLGAVARYLTGLACVRLLGDRFAYGTLAVNVAGCLFLGLLMHVGSQSTHWLNGLPLTALSVGFLGALTTFSTFGYETLHYLETGRHSLAAANVAANVLLGILAAWGGVQLGQCLDGSA